MVNTNNKQSSSVSLNNNDIEINNKNSNNLINHSSKNVSNGAVKLIPFHSVLSTADDPNKLNQHHVQQSLPDSNNQLPHELPQEDEERLAKLFKHLDRDGNGKIDIHDLSEALREFGLSSVYAEVNILLIHVFCIM